MFFMAFYDFIIYGLSYCVKEVNYIEFLSITPFQRTNERSVLCFTARHA